ncbi:MAG TPA: FAD-binding oxidoreductase [Solirubrobacteraceae bacterium]|jgi:decaprenylphospho-beta-D-ribofuranose 2-oxidase|nr:FAD-binding oxidoreductase [Solirubrobacteraceae bacterium]
MSAIELSARPATFAVERSLCGWGRTAPSTARVLTPASPAEACEALDGLAERGGALLARGAGRSYGDAAQNGGGTVLDMTRCARIGEPDERSGLVRAQAGATLAEVIAQIGVHGRTLPVVPGTRHVTVAGAIASDIHGKNHHRDGAFARHVESISLWTPAAGVLALSQQDDPELFYATLGGMGLTGVILDAELRTEPLGSWYVSGDTDRTASLAATLQLLAEPERHRYSVAWLDLLARGSRFGRAVLSRANPLDLHHDGVPLRERARALAAAPRVRVPAASSVALVDPRAIRALNAARWAASPRRARERPERLDRFFFPLDALGDWNRLYGSRGLIQYQLVIPDGREADLDRCFELIRARRVPVCLAVLKRFGPHFGGPLSFPIGGWTLAADVPAAAPGVGAALDALDQIVAEAGGRVYLSKDSRLRPEVLASMYGELDRFRATAARVDPDGLMSSDLSRRLELRAEAP